MLLGVALTVVALLHTCENKAVYNDNAFENVLVVVDNNIKEYEKFYEAIQTLLTTGSEALYKATKGRTYFRSVDVLLPSSWKSNPNIGVAGEQSFQIADLIVAPTNPAHGDGPYVSQPGGCGEPGRFIHLTATYLAGLRKNSGKELVQNWAKYRYGVFDESAPYPRGSGDVLSSNYRPFYPSGDDKNPQFSPSTCGHLKGEMKHADGSKCKIENNWIDHQCQFVPDKEQSINSSLMYTHELDQVEEFCEDHGPNAHNPLAMNEQNDKCDYRSVWSVLLQHQDFANFKPNQNYQGTSPPAPTFNFVQPTTATKRVVYVLDTSGSLAGCAAQNMLQVAKASISSLALPVELGIVEFNNLAKTLMKVTRLDSFSDLGKALDNLPANFVGSTCIACGAKNALKILGADNKETKGSTMLLLSDGEENTDSIIRLLPEIKKAGLIVNTVAVGPVADPILTEVAERTGGKAFYVANVCGSGFQYVTSMIDSSKLPNDKLIDSHDIFIPGMPGEKLHYTFAIDSTIGLNTRITIIYEQKNVGIEFIFTDPNNGVYKIEAVREGHIGGKVRKIKSDPGGVEIETYVEGGLLVLRIPAVIVGEWKYVIGKLATSQPSTLTNGSISILSQPSAEGSDSLLLLPYSSPQTLDLSKSSRLVIYAPLSRGSVPVLNAYVYAVISRETILSNVTLNDNGEGADNIANDGVYSGFFINFVPNGEQVQLRYTVTVTATNGPKTVYAATPGVLAQPTGAFERGSTFIFVVNNVGQLPQQPPNRIRNFRVESFDSVTRKITFAWTAPGGQRDVGAARQYEFASSSNISNLIPDVTGEAKILNPLQGDRPLTPFGYGERQTLVVVVISIQSGPIYARMRSINVFGVKSDWSNVASTLIVTAPPPPPTEAPIAPVATNGSVAPTGPTTATDDENGQMATEPPAPPASEATPAPPDEATPAPTNFSVVPSVVACPSPAPCPECPKQPFPPILEHHIPLVEPLTPEQQQGEGIAPKETLKYAALHDKIVSVFEEYCKLGSCPKP